MPMTRIERMLRIAPGALNPPCATPKTALNCAWRVIAPWSNQAVTVKSVSSVMNPWVLDARPESYGALYVDRL